MTKNSANIVVNSFNWRKFDVGRILEFIYIQFVRSFEKGLPL